VVRTIVRRADVGRVVEQNQYVRLLV